MDGFEHKYKYLFWNTKINIQKIKKKEKYFFHDRLFLFVLIMLKFLKNEGGLPPLLAKSKKFLQVHENFNHANKKHKVFSIN